MLLFSPISLEVLSHPSLSFVQVLNKGLGIPRDTEPSSFGCLALFPALAWALSRSRSLWLPRSLKLWSTNTYQNPTQAFRLVAEKMQENNFLIFIVSSRKFNYLRSKKIWKNTIMILNFLGNHTEGLTKPCYAFIKRKFAKKTLLKAIKIGKQQVDLKSEKRNIS